VSMNVSDIHLNTHKHTIYTL